MLRFLWLASRGYRFRLWQSPYLRWRIETYSGIPAQTIGFPEFWRFFWTHRDETMRFLRWAGRMEHVARR